MNDTSSITVWVLGDQLDRELGALGSARPETHRVLLVESHGLLQRRRWHRQRAHLVIASMRRFALELRELGFDVDYRKAAASPTVFALIVRSSLPTPWW